MPAWARSNKTDTSKGNITARPQTFRHLEGPREQYTAHIHTMRNNTMRIHTITHGSVTDTGRGG